MGPVLWVSGQAVSGLGVAALGVVVGYFAGMFGVGGGFIMTPMLVVLFRVPLPIAVGSGLCQMVGTSLATYLRHRRLGQGESRFDLLMLPASLAGVELGTRTLTRLADAGSVHIGARSIPWMSLVIEVAYTALLLWVARSYLFHGRGGPVSLQHVRPGPLSRVRFGPTVDFPRAGLRGVSGAVVAYLGLGLGFLSGLLGIGGGVALNPVLIYGYGFAIRQAAGTGVLVLFVTAVFGTWSHALRGHVHLGLALTLLVGGTIASQLGALASQRLSGRVLARLQAMLVLGAVCAVVWDLVTKLR
jgi:uncharacterized protein